MSTPHPSPTLVARLHDLHDQYVDAVNRAVAEDRDDIIVHLAADYTDDAVALMGGRPLAA